MTKYLLLTKYDDGEDLGPMLEWTPGDIKTHLAFLRELNQSLTDSGELIEAWALTGPDLAKIVVSDGVSAPVVTDGPFPEVKELLAGYQMVDVETEERAVRIAAQVSAAPGPGGQPLRQRIEVRRVMGAPGVEE